MNPVLRHRIAISELAYDVVWHSAGLDDKHNALSAPSPGSTWEERAALERKALAELASVGLAVDNRIDPELVGTIRLIAKPHQELYGWFTPEPGAPTRSVLAVRVGRDALLTRLEDGNLILEPVDPAAVPDAVAGLVPMRPAADSPALKAALSELDKEPDQYEDDYDGSVMVSSWQAPRQESDVEKVRRLLDEPRSGTGQFFAAVRDDQLGRRRCAHPLSYVDTAQGRYVTRIRRSNGVTSLLMTPADNGALADHLRSLLTNIR